MRDRIETDSSSRSALPIARPVLRVCRRRAPRMPRHTSTREIASPQVWVRKNANSAALNAQFLQDLVRASLPLGNDRVADVLEILDAHLAGPESAGSQIAEHVEERHAV